MGRPGGMGPAGGYPPAGVSQYHHHQPQQHPRGVAVCSLFEATNTTALLLLPFLLMILLVLLLLAGGALAHGERGEEDGRGGRDLRDAACPISTG